jgi:hypothetical protein
MATHAKPTKDEIDVAVKATGTDAKDLYATTIVRLYNSDPESTKFHYTGIYGVLSLHLDTRTNAVYIKLTDLNTKQLAFVQECYTEFFHTYQILSPHFHCFETEGQTIGLCFAEEFDGDRFRRMVSDLIVGSAKLAPKLEPTNLSPRGSSESNGRESGKDVKSYISRKPKTQEPDNASGGFLSFFGIGKKAPEVVTSKPKLKISAPSNVVHVSGFGNYFGENVNDQNKIPQEWIEIFQAAGLTHEEMQDDKIAKFVMGTVVADKETKAKIKEEAATITAPKVPTRRKTKIEERPVLTTPDNEESVKETPVVHHSGGNRAPPPPGPPPGPPPPPTGEMKSKPIAKTEGSSNGEVKHDKPKRDPPSGERGDLLSAIAKGTTLKKVDLTQTVKKMDAEEKNDMAATIAAAMKIRREVVDSDDEGDRGDDW